MPADGHGASDAIARSRQREKRFGYRRLFVLLRQEGEPSGIYRIYRLCREEGLTVRKRRARRRAVGSRAPIMVESKPNARWSVDFVHDQLACGRRLRILNIVDDVTRECLAAIPHTSISGRRVARELTALIKRRGKPGMIVSDNGTFERNVRLGAGQQRRLVFHCARKADAEWLLREFQPAHTRRAS
jgi:putative transposase